MPSAFNILPNVPLNSSHREQHLLRSLSDSAQLKSSLKQATLPVPNPTRSYWLNYPSPSVNELANEGSEDLLTSKVDVCIIGSGITGVGAAYYFAEAIKKMEGDPFVNEEFRVVVVEARDFCV